MKTILFCTALLLSSSLAQAEGGHWMCMHNGHEMKVDGKDAKAKKVACEKKGGKWEEMKHEETKQSSGGGGGW